ncbi:MAG: aspartate 1-decarboxylase [Nanobdellota archaeon]
MGRILLRSKIHRATVTMANRDYEGSITIDAELLKQANIAPYEQVHVVSVDTGARLITYAIPGYAKEICMNGAAANLIKEGETIIIMAFCTVPENQVANVSPILLFLDKNEIKNDA